MNYKVILIGCMTIMTVLAVPIVNFNTPNTIKLVCIGSMLIVGIIGFYVGAKHDPAKKKVAIYLTIAAVVLLLVLGFFVMSRIHDGALANVAVATDSAKIHL
jgi:hypothetical protein